jgi:hypothetical protein
VIADIAVIGKPITTKDTKEHGSRGIADIAVIARDRRNRKAKSRFLPFGFAQGRNDKVILRGQIGG